MVYINEYYERRNAAILQYCAILFHKMWHYDKVFELELTLSLNLNFLQYICLYFMADNFFVKVMVTHYKIAILSSVYGLYK